MLETIIVYESQRAFLFKYGVYKKMLMPGKYKINHLFGESYTKVNVSEQVKVPDLDIAVLMHDVEFAESVDKIDVPDGHIAFHTEDGRIAGILRPGTYCFWNCYRKHEFKLVPIPPAEEITGLTKEELLFISQTLYFKTTVPDGLAGLLYIGGKFTKKLESGTYYFWNSVDGIRCDTVDTRLQQLDIAGQEILTSDKVSLRINFVCTYKITDPIKAASNLKDYKSQVYTVTQLALREYVGKFRFDELLEQKDSIAAFVLEKLQAKQSELFVQFTDAGLKDIILPGEIRDIMNTVLVAEKNAQANVIARREEVASTRSLLNTAKLMEENTVLYKLKELEYLEKICDKVGNISVGGGNLLTELWGLLKATY